jgi:HK97 family phage major capsid protein
VLSVKVWSAISPESWIRRSRPIRRPTDLLSVATTAADAGDVWANLDAFEFAKSNAEQHNTVVDSWLCNPSTALKLATLKESAVAGSNRALLAPDPSAPASRVISGIPVVTSPAIGNDIVYGVPRDRVVIALRQGTTVEPDRSVYFTSDRTAVKAIVRVSWAFTDPASITKIAPTP